MIFRKVKAVTIPETIVSLVIILAIFGIATTLFVHVTRTSISLKNVNAYRTLEAYAAMTSWQHEPADDSTQINGFRIQRQVSRADASGALWRIHFYIYDNTGLLITDWQEYVLDK